MARLRKQKTRWFWLERKKRWLVIPGLLVLFILVLWLWPLGSLFQEPLSPVLFSGEGQLLGARLAQDGQWRFPRCEEVPDKYFKAVLQFEDRRFYLHPGVDPIAVARAVWQNLKAGEVKSGASTITMQLARLVEKNSRRTLWQKIKEATLALRLELRYSKKEILSLFADQAPFGRNIVGINAASWFYFGRSPEDLSWAEACFLAVLPKNPSLVAENQGLQKLKLKRDRLLWKLWQHGYLAELEYRLACSEPIPVSLKPVPRDCQHLLDTLVKDQEKKTPFYSFINYDLQQRLNLAAEAYGEKLLNRGIRNLAVVVVDNKKGGVVAYVGNVGKARSFDSAQYVDIAQSPRSTGSILKPFLYGLMLQEGLINPEMLVPDIPTRYEGFRPKNFDRQFRGAVPAKTALAWSLNVPAVRLLHQYGIAKFKNKLSRWGMATLFRPAEDYGLSLILGGAEGRLVEITSMYAEMGRRAMGLEDDSWKIRILTDEKKILSGLRELSPGAAYLTLQALTEVNRPDEEGFWRNFSSARWVAWKTGTSFGLKDAWAVGVTPNYTVGVWAGNADGEGRPEITGLTAAAPFLFEVLGLLDTGGEIAAPPGSLKTIEVCRDSGYLAGELCPQKDIWVPAESHFDRTCVYHQLVHLDPAGRYRVDSRFESVARMNHQSWFVLPPVQEYYYRTWHPEYRPLPPLRPGNSSRVDTADGSRIMNLVYPEPGTAVFIPVDLDGQAQEVVFEAVHRQKEALIHWHLDEDYLTTTRHFHKIALNPPAGEHQLVLVDGEGRRLVRKFTVMGKSGT
ncbi:MAG: penicillin-binding protein 1C [Acidobacteriota bacterium]|nr:penicillin-binding protein 1C [Acidobacteriota bacterium]MDW3228735.1 penicillin-binding protein 1C [Acidobacteriota bacterium]